MESPRKLILLSPDPAEEARLREYLAKDTADNYSLAHIETVDKLRSFAPASMCEGILLDMRFGHTHLLENIDYLSDLQASVALIALYRDHEQLQSDKKLIHLLDDYLLTSHLIGGELPTRIAHVIRRRQKEQKSLREKALLQSLLDSLPEAIFFKDQDSRFIRVNQSMEQIHGLSHGSILGKTDFDLFTEEEARKAYEEEQDILRQDVPEVARLERKTLEDGSIKWTNTTKLPLKNSQGRIIGTMGIVRNVTDLKKAQDTLTHERILLKTIIEHALAGIFVKDPTGRYMVVNQRHATYLGARSVEDVIGKTLHDFFAQDEAERISKADQRTMVRGIGIENMVDHRKRDDGSELWLLTSKVPLKDDYGKVLGLVGVSLDVTEHKLNERKLQTTIKMLEETKLQLIEAEKLKTVGRLAAGVAHEVKNPLNIVSLGMEYLESRIEEPEEILQIIRDMRNAVKKANEVIFELLDYSSPHKLRMEPGEINALIQRVLAMMRHRFNEAGIQVEEDFDHEIEPVRIDAQKMEQVFINLFLNAIAAMPRKPGQLTVRTRMTRMKSSGSNVSGTMTELFRIGSPILVVEVLDTGSGLTRDDEQKAFDPFYSSKSTGQGTGLGLSVTRSIVDLHHGMITLKNRNDRPGACVRILLPTANHQKNDPAPKNKP